MSLSPLIKSEHRGRERDKTRLPTSSLCGIYLLAKNQIYISIYGAWKGRVRGEIEYTTGKIATEHKWCKKEWRVLFLFCLFSICLRVCLCKRKTICLRASALSVTVQAHTCTVWTDNNNNNEIQWAEKRQGSLGGLLVIVLTDCCFICGYGCCIACRWRWHICLPPGTRVRRNWFLSVIWSREDGFFEGLTAILFGLFIFNKWGSFQ